MLLPSFELHKPTTVAEAVALAVGFDDDFDFLSGGTDLLPNYKCGLNARGHVISLQHIDELRQITASRIGAGATLTEIESHELLPTSLRETARGIASPLLRESGTIGGNLMLDTRCHFFNQSYFWRRTLGYCLKAEGDLCHVVPKILVDGKSVANNSICVATHSSDLAPMLVALNATITLHGPGGPRTLPLHEFYLGDGIERFDLRRPEILVRVDLPQITDTLRAGYLKLAPRRSIDFPALGVAAALDSGADGAVISLRVCLGAIDTMPMLYDYSGASAREPANQLCTDPREGMPTVIGRKLDDSLIAEIAAHIEKTASPKLTVPMEPAYRRKMCGVFTRRLLTGFKNP